MKKAIPHIWIVLSLLMPASVWGEPESEPGPQDSEVSQASETFGPDEKLASPQPPAPPQPYQLTDIFSVEQNPGRGTLEFTQGNQVEKITFGREGGLYGLGMVFRGAKLPFQYGNEFKDEFIIQIALGTLKSRLERQIPQFAAASLIAEKVPTGATRFVVKMPQEGKPAPEKNLGLVLFSSPLTPNNLGDEFKLKNTYFAQSGSLTLSRETKPRVIDVKAQGELLNFKLLLMKVVFDLTLGTPFNSEPASLKGTIEFPVYSPKGSAAVKFTERIASESFVGTMGLRGGRRGVAETKK